MTQALNRNSGQKTAHGEQLQPQDLATITFRPTCPKCGGLTGQWRGYRETRKGVFHRRWCRSCGKWFSVNLCRGAIASHLALEDDIRNEKLQFDAWIEAYEESLSRGDAL